MTMSNPLKRVMNPVEEVDDATPYQQEIWQYFGTFPDTPRQSQHHGSDIPVMQPANSLPDLFGDYNPTSELAEWGNSMALPNFDSSQLTPISFQENSPSPSITPESTQLRAKSVTSADDEETICYGKLHNLDVKLVGEMQIIDSKLGKSSAGYERFKLNEQQDHVLLCFPDDGEEFGYLRSGVGKTLAPLLAKSYVEFEPIATTSNLKETIGRANKPAEAMVKVGINVYGRRWAAAEVGDALSRGKLWLQKPGHTRRGVAYDNPHFLPLKINGVQVQPVQPVSRVPNEGLAGKKHREGRLRKMVEEVYKSLGSTRHLDMVEGGNRVTAELLKHQQEALGFMLERESGHINDKYRLWKTVTLEDGREEYRHRITKAKAKQGIKPNERGGGILADEMGMGKSLSILALAMRTLDDGEEWAQQQNDGAEGKGPLKYSRSTLVVAPSALLINNWMDEIKKHLKGGLTVIKYHGPRRPKDLEKISESDIVVTTYNTLTTEFQAKSKPSLLHRIGWYRVVLDEAHIIRRPATAFYHACSDLHANSRWCLTGTPIQNKLADLGALFAFIRAEPFSKAAIFRKWIDIPFEQSIYDPTVVKNRLIMLLEALCLRRTKDVIKLPGLRQRMRTLVLSPAERKQYENTSKILMRKIRHRVNGVDKIYKFGLFQANLQMRLLCNHGTFQRPFSWNRRSYRDEREAVVSALGQNGEITCSGCQLPMPILGLGGLGNGFREQCAHLLCSECLEESSSTPGAAGQTQHCPVCAQRPAGAPVEARGAAGDAAMPDWPAKQAIGDDDDSYFNSEGHSTKMRACIEDVHTDLWTTKSIIFSCWTRTLYLLSKHLHEAKIPHLRIDGSCSLSQRQAKLDQFSEDDKMPVLIMTTGTGAFGLNLTCANRVFILELQWNPSVESQAIARAIRLGQENEVHVTRYVIKDTVEQDMRSQQQWKKQIAALGFEEVPDVIDDEQGVS
ncbi:SNF2 family N-terminal domain-containing protein [Phialemonium atrogriseum]|uniref:SNF2 family N-terminal domain-containing protein n=1 Tax=Phialemonium atrogriseum TaxID=1093897 RepID=A0AAJ0FJZ9_9PEZI|nr:SNF2 family N-terminal domain-containing protein [Phialemonium atrogriseum]KAK1765014.1 SNF2 family N-terminal domain-containing protein [Phialemonium atrogriseum]